MNSTHHSDNACETTNIYTKVSKTDISKFAWSTLLIVHYRPSDILMIITMTMLHLHSPPWQSGICNMGWVSVKGVKGLGMGRGCRP